MCDLQPRAATPCLFWRRRAGRRRPRLGVFNLSVTPHSLLARFLVLRSRRRRRVRRCGGESRRCSRIPEGVCGDNWFGFGRSGWRHGRRWLRDARRGNWLRRRIISRRRLSAASVGDVESGRAGGVLRGTGKMRRGVVCGGRSGAGCTRNRRVGSRRRTAAVGAAGGTVKAGDGFEGGAGCGERAKAKPAQVVSISQGQLPSRWEVPPAMPASEWTARRSHSRCRSGGRRGWLGSRLHRWRRLRRRGRGGAGVVGFRAGTGLALTGAAVPAVGGVESAASLTSSEAHGWRRRLRFHLGARPVRGGAVGLRRPALFDGGLSNRLLDFLRPLNPLVRG